MSANRLKPCPPGAADPVVSQGSGLLRRQAEAVDQPGFGAGGQLLADGPGPGVHHQGGLACWAFGAGFG